MARQRPRGRLLAPAARETLRNIALTAAGLVVLLVASHARAALEAALGVSL